MNQIPSHAATATAFSHDDYTIGWICALPLEMAVAKAMLDIIHSGLPNPPNDHNTYTLGKMGPHNVVVACMPSGVYGTTSAATVASQMLSSFPSVRFGLMVGIGGGAPNAHADIRLGDVVVCRPTESFGGVVQYDYGKTVQEDSFKRTGTLNKPPQVLLTAVSSLQADYSMRPSRIPEYLSEMAAIHPTMASKFAYPNQHPDRLFEAQYEHIKSEDTCDKCDPSRLENRRPRAGNSPMIHYGLIASANQVMKHAGTRDRLARELGILCFEMEAGGLMDNFPCLIIRGICDYADSHKSKQWQNYAAATAAAYAKEILSVIPAVQEWRSGDRAIRRPAETLPSPSSFVPFPRDQDFVHREALLNQIHKTSSGAGSRTVLVGLGGVGKSQLAIEYSYQIRDRSPDTWVFWVHASNVARFEQSYWDIAEQVKIPERKSSQANIFKLVHDWLRDKRNGSWLLILDNVDDAGFLLETRPRNQESQPSGYHGRNSQPLVAYLPRSENGSILITTRTKVVSIQLAEKSHVIAVEPMDEAHAIALFEKKLGEQGDRKNLAKLVLALEFMPLAIVQAAAYISQRAPRCSVRQYIDKFQRSDTSKMTLLDYEGGHLRRDWEAKNSILITWQLSFNHILQTRPSAADLLSLMSFFDCQGIPEALLQDRPAADSGCENIEEADLDDGEDDDKSASESCGSKEFEEDVLTLRNYSFISANADTTTFEMHRLVQVAMRKWLDAHGRLERWKQQYIKNLCNEFPTGEHENWVKCQVLFPHAKLAISQQPKGDDSLGEWASLLYCAAWYAVRRGHVADAATMSTNALKARKKVLGPEHAKMLSSMGMLGLAYHLGGRWKEAEELEVQVMETKKRVLGAEHPNTLASISNLAVTYMNQGRWKEAEELQVQVKETSSRVLGVAHPSTLTSMGNLASTYMNQGRWKEAEELEVQVMEMSSRVLGAEHPDTLTSMNNLAFIWKEKGRHTEASTLMEECVRQRSKILGVGHPDTTSSSKVLTGWKTEELQIGAFASEDTGK